MHNIGIIPARYASTRFPGKPLSKIGEKTMIQRVYEQCQKSSYLDEILVATDDHRIFEHVQSFSGAAVMTSTEHQSGTDRIAEAVEKKFPAAKIVVNIQGDEPFIEPSLIDSIIQPLQDGKAAIATACKRIKDSESIFNPNTVKVIFNQKKEALYFTRSPIPHIRNTIKEDWLGKGVFYKHIGIYGFQKAVLMEITQAPMSVLEKLEALEQLRWLDLGYTLYVEETEHESIGIDTPEDLEKANAFINYE